jgi:competence protein ComEC
MRMKVLQFPLIKITVCFVLGIIFSHVTKISFWTGFSLLLVGFSLSLFSYLFFKTHKSLRIYFGIFSLFTAFSIGSFALICNNETRNTNHYIHQIDASQESYLSEVIILEKLKNTSKNDRYITEIYLLNDKQSSGKVILNIRKDRLLPTLEIGSHLKVEGTFYKNRNPNNPNQFDYGKYLENKQIYAQIYADAKDIKISSITDTNLNFYASKIRNKIIYNLEKNGFNKTELSVVAALILGQQQDISPEIVLDYQYAGAIHVLSVSGLHVGFILLFITFLLKPFPNTKTGSLLKLLIVVISLWLFGILAGLAPCVIRSVTMFSFVAIGMYLRRTVNIYNTLLVSVLLILLIEPSFLFDIGFQLSYVALFFIIWFQPLLKSIWDPKNKVKIYFWDIITVSFAAQIGTLPMTIYYFHQFPGLFFITNLIILPALTIILALGVLVMTLASFDFVWLPMMKLLQWTIWLLDETISWIASFDSFIIKDISLTSFLMISLYLLIITWIIYFKKPNFVKFTIGLSTIILVQFFLFQAKYSNEKASEFIVFTKSKISIITERKGSKINLYSNDSILKNVDDNLAIKSYLIANFCSIDKKQTVSNLYYFKGKKILVLDSSAVYLNNEKPDILILTNSPKVSLERIFKSWKPEQVVVDASNFKSYIKIWKATCVKEKIPFHATAEKGFYKL